MAGQNQHTISAEAALAGILVLLVEEREMRTQEQQDAAKTEVLLDRAGLAAEDIHAVTGKTPGAIRKSIQRARAK